MTDRRAFFDSYRASFGRLTKAQVPALDFLLDRLDRSTEIHGLAQDAYVLATSKHETGHTFLPIVERGPRSYFDKYEPGTRIGDRLGNRKPGDGFRYRGRGQSMITGLDNYARFADLLGIDLVGNPDLALDPEYAWQIIELGMAHGLFTGRTLGASVAAHATVVPHAAFVEARRVINGTDKAELIAGYAVELLRALTASTQEVRS